MAPVQHQGAQPMRRTCCGRATGRASLSLRVTAPAPGMALAPLAARMVGLRAVPVVARLALITTLAVACHLDQLVRADAATAPPSQPRDSTGTAGLPAVRLVFTVQPSNTAMGAVIHPAVEVTAYDSLGNVAATFSGAVRVAIGRDASLLGNATLSGATSVAASKGIAVFPDLSIDQVGTGYTLTAAFGGSAPGATSAAFDVGL